MERKRITCVILAVAMIFALAGCGGEAVVMKSTDQDSRTAAIDKRDVVDDKIKQIEKPDVSNDPDPPEVPVSGEDVNHHWFEEAFQAYIDDSDSLGGVSYMASPASFRAALCLAIEGSDGETKTGLLNAAGFESENDMRRWYDNLLKNQAEFRDRAVQLQDDMNYYDLDGEGSVDLGMAFDIANAVWDNTDFPGGFQELYMDFISERYGATAGSSNSGTITADVNAWCRENTNGMIEKISNDLSQSSGVLANALYVKSGWLDEFYDGATEKDNFTLSDGSVIDLDFMHRVGDYTYLEDQSGRRYALFGLEGGIWLTVCLDDSVRITDMLYAQYNGQSQKLDVAMPKLDLETTLDADLLCGYLASNGAGAALGDGADFSRMTDSPDGWHIGDAVQKTRLKTDEQGMEAAAVTVIAMVDNAAVIEPEELVEFHMDRPFSFLITYGLHTRDSDVNILFFGRFTGK